MRGFIVSSGNVFLFLLLSAFHSPLDLSAAESPGSRSALFEAPVPFYHTYNLTSLFPVSKAFSGAAGQSGSGAVETLTLDECIDRALGRNPVYGKSRENLRAVTGDILAAWGSYLPTFGAGFGMSQSNQTRAYMDPSGNLRLQGGISKASWASLRFNYTIFNRAAKYFQMKNAHFLRRERTNDLHDSELALVELVRSAYFNALREEKLLVAANNQADQRRDQLKLAEARFSVGSVTKLDVLQAQIELKDQELNILQYENGQKKTKMELNRLMGENLNNDFALANEFTVMEVDLDVDKLVGEALKNHPQVKSLEYRIKQQKGTLWMGRLAYLPALNTSLNYSRSEDGLKFRPNLNKGRDLRFSMSWDIFDSFNRFRQNRYTEVTLNNLSYDLAGVRLEIEKNVRGNHLELLRLFQRSQILAESQDLASQSLELERERYRLGSSSLLDLRQAQVDYSDAEVAYINSVYDFHGTLSSLSRYVGRDLSLN